MDRFDRLLRPRSIAVIGGGAWCKNVMQQCDKIGFDGDLWPVHLTEAEVNGRKAYPSVDALPHAPDAAFVGVNRIATIEIIGQLRDGGAGGAICFASGFQESVQEADDGADLQQKLLHAAGDMTIIGPNCYGLINYLDGVALWPDQHGGKPCDRGVAIITQSSNIAINLTMQNRGLPIAYIVTAGNQAQTGMSEIGAALLADPRVTALGLHIEGIDDIRAFENLAQTARKLGKPTIAIKVGSSEQAQKATISHTASIAGSDAGADAFLSRLGIGRVSGLSSFLECLKILHVAGPLKSKKIASMSCSGGEASLFSDTINGSSVSFPPLTIEQSRDLRDALGPMVALANPLDYHTYIWNDVDAMARTYLAMSAPDLGLVNIVVDFPRSDRCDAADWDCVIEAATQAKAEAPIALLSTLPENMPEEVAERVIAAGMIPLAGLESAAEAIEVAAELIPPVSDLILLPRPSTRDILLSEFDAKQILSDFGIATPRNARAKTADAVDGAIAGLSFPLVLKGEGLAHKSEAGAVKLSLSDASAVKAAALAMDADSYLIEEMVRGSVCEILVGVVCDPAHGHVLTLAAGGVYTEILGDQASLLVPSDRASVKAALMSLKMAPIFLGYRGAKPPNVDAILDTIMALQELVRSRHIIEIEINPLICTPQSAIACDALIKIGATQ